MRRFGEAVLGILITGAVVANAADSPKPNKNPPPLTPVFKQNGGGWGFAASYRNSTAAEEDLPEMMAKSSIVLDGKEHPRQGIRFGGRSNLHPGESWTVTIEMSNYLSKDVRLTEGRHTLSLKFGSQEFGPAEFVWAPATEPQPAAVNGDTDKLLEAIKNPDWQAINAIASKIEEQLAQKGPAAEDLTGSLLARKADFVSSAEVITLLNDMSKKHKSVEAARLLVRIASARRTVQSFKRGHVIVGQLIVEDEKVNPEMVMAQMPISPDGYFAGEVGDLKRPVGFRAHGYQNLDVSLAGKEGDMVYVGQVSLKPLTGDQQASLKGKITLDGAETVESAEVLLSMSVSGINTPHNGYSPRRSWPDALHVPVNKKGEFSIKGLSPASYYMQIKAKDHVDLAKTVTFQPGKELDMDVCRLQCTDLGFYIGGPPPRSEELKWEKDYGTALKRAQAEKKPMLIMMTATWCGWCKVLEKETLNDPWVRHFLSGFVVVKAYEDRDVEKQYGQSGYPTLVFTDSNGKELHKTVGHKPRLTFSSECAKAFRKLDLKPPSELQALVDKKVITND